MNQVFAAQLIKSEIMYALHRTNESRSLHIGNNQFFQVIDKPQIISINRPTDQKDFSFIDLWVHMLSCQQVRELHHLNDGDKKALQDPWVAMKFLEKVGVQKSIIPIDLSRIVIVTTVQLNHLFSSNWNFVSSNIKNLKIKPDSDWMPQQFYGELSLSYNSSDQTMSFRMSLAQFNYIGKPCTDSNDQEDKLEFSFVLELLFNELVEQKKTTFLFQNERQQYNVRTILIPLKMYFTQKQLQDALSKIELKRAQVTYPEDACQSPQWKDLHEMLSTPSASDNEFEMFHRDLDISLPVFSFNDF